MNLKIRTIFAVALALALTAFWATPNRAQKGRNAASSSASLRNHTFESGEELVYVAEFSRLLLKKIDVADFRFSAGRQADASNGQSEEVPKTLVPSALKLTGDITSKGFFAKLFNLTFRERVESIVDPKTFTVQKTTRTDEQGKRVRISETTYDRGKLFWIERDPNNPSREPRTTTANFTGQVQDVLSAVYYLRKQSLDPGRSFEITLSDSGRIYQVPVRVMERRRMKTVLGRVEVVRVDPQVYGPNALVRGKGQFSIWLTNDNRRIPVSAKIKTEYGTFDITLRKVIHPNPAGALAQN